MRFMLTVTVLLLSLPAAGQHDHPTAAASPYGDLAGRRIKALSDEDITRLANGEGMGFALSAELNHYPGPRHVLDLADQLALSREAREAVEAIRVRMNERARALGTQIVAAEAALDEAFVTRTITSPALASLTARIAELTGALRATHLTAHLEVTALLSPEQVDRYDALRRYRGSPSER